MPKLITPKPELTELTDAFIDHALIEDYRPFANGTQEVNNHLDGAYDEIKDESLRGSVAKQGKDLLGLAEENEDIYCQLDFIAPVPTGAIGWAYVIARELRRPSMQVLHLDKVAKRKFKLNDFSKYQIENLLALYKQPRGVVLDDVSSDGGTGEAMADFLADLELETSLIMVLLFRGDIRDLKTKYHRATVMQKHIPYKIDWKVRRESGLIVPEAKN